MLDIVDGFTPVFSWLEDWGEAFWWLAAFSAVSFAGSLALIPYLAVRMPADYFSAAHRRRATWSDRHPALRICLLILKNLFGATLLLAGILMLFLPGQGLLTIFFAVMLMDFPGKYRLERYVVSRGPVLKAINWMRRRRGVGDLEEFDSDGNGGA